MGYRGEPSRFPRRGRPPRRRRVRGFRLLHLARRRPRGSSLPRFLRRYALVSASWLLTGLHMQVGCFCMRPAGTAEGRLAVDVTHNKDGHAWFSKNRAEP